MGRRNDIDWEAVERLYVAGQLTVRQVADECGINVSTLTAKAKKLGWIRNLSSDIEALTKAKIAAIDVSALVEQSAQQNAQKSAQTIKDAIEQASDVAAGIVIKHRAGLRLDMERAETVSGLLEEALSQAEGIKDIVSVTQALKNLADIRCKLRDQERTIYGLDKDKPQDTGLSKESVATLKRLKEQLENA